MIKDSKGKNTKSYLNAGFIETLDSELTYNVGGLGGGSGISVSPRGMEQTDRKPDYDKLSKITSNKFIKPSFK